MLTRKQLTYDDSQAMSTLPHVVAVSPALQYTDNNAPGRAGVTAIKGNGKTMQNTILTGLVPAQEQVQDLNLTEGRFINQEDLARAAKVTVLGSDTAAFLFPVQSAIGQDVQAAGMVFTVVGVLDKHKQAFGGGANPQDNEALFPLTTFHYMHPEMLDYWITLKYDDAKNRAAGGGRADRTVAAAAEGAERQAGQLLHLRDGYAAAAVGSDYVWAVPADVFAVVRGAAGGGVG